MRIEVDGDRAMFALQSGDSRELHDIVTILMPEWAQLFARKNAEYGGGENGNASVLGIKGQYADIWRKMSKLKRAMWDGEQLEFEGTEEVISDMIGHLFLTLYMLRLREETDRSHVYSSDSTDVFVNRLIDELGGPEQALRVSGALSEALSSQVTARCRQMASEGFYEPDADAPVDPDDEEHSAREAVRRYDREIATPAVTQGISINEYEIMRRQDAMAKRLKRGTDERLYGAREARRRAREEAGSPGEALARATAERDAYGFRADGADESPLERLRTEEFAESDAAQHGVGDPSVATWREIRREKMQKVQDALSNERDVNRLAAFGESPAAPDESEDEFEAAYADEEVEQKRVVVGYNFETEGKVGPARIVTEQQNGVTRYFHEEYPGSDREPLSLVPTSLIGRLEKDHYVLSQDTKGGLRELASWAERTR
jgi:hypothetical protein